MTEHIREEYALQRPNGEINGNFWPEWLNGDEAKTQMEALAHMYRDQNLTVVHRTVTFTDWEEVRDA